MLHRAVIVGLLLVSTAAAQAPAPADTLVIFTMPDQFDVEHTATDLRGTTALVIWADRKGNDHRRRWVKTIARKLRRELTEGTVILHQVAHVQGVPGFVKGRVLDSFREEADGPVLMDWEGVFDAAYTPTADHVNVLVFDADGRLAHQAAATGLDQGVLDGILNAVRAAVADGPPGMPSSPVRATD